MDIYIYIYIYIVGDVYTPLPELTSGGASEKGAVENTLQRPTMGQLSKHEQVQLSGLGVGRGNR